MHRLWIAAFFIIALLSTARAEGGIGAWERWEHQLTSDRDYPNPCTDVQVHVQFNGPQGCVRQGMGFWDGDKCFRIRCAFPSPGEWTWHTTCSDTTNHGLDGQSGTVQVKSSRGKGVIKKHGYPKVSTDGRLLIHADGTPFLWVGDTCWAAPVHATEMEWKRYVLNRASKGYSVLQISIAPDWALEHSRLGISPFLSQLPDITKPNPQFFQALDQKMAVANDAGLIVLMVGLMETPYRYPQPEQTAVLSRYIATRYSSFAAIFSPSFDSGIHETETLASVNAIREAAPTNLITMHMGTGVPPRFHTSDWLSFDMYQSGHNGGDAVRQSERATDMPADILALTPRKPIINGEAIYEGDLGGAYGVRRTAWLSFLSGAVGYTAGINQVYKWTEDVTAKMNVPSSDQISLLARSLGTTSWWNLEPAPWRILNQPQDRARLMAFALMKDHALGLGYLPGNESINLNLEVRQPRYNMLWINPATGSWCEGSTIATSREVDLKPPDARDWVLLLAQPSSPAIDDFKKTLRRIGYNQHKSTGTITFSQTVEIGGLVLKTPSDGVFQHTNFQGIPCIANQNPNRNSYLYIDVDDRLAFRGGAKKIDVEVQIESSEPLEGIQLQYDADGASETNNIYRPVVPSGHKKKGRWTAIRFCAESPYLGNRQNSGADFRVFLDGKLCHIAAIKVWIQR